MVVLYDSIIFHYYLKKTVSIGNFFQRQGGKGNRENPEHFDAIYTKQRVFLTPPDPLVMLNMDDDDFFGFSYRNADFESDSAQT